MNTFELSYNRYTVLPDMALQSHLLTLTVFLVWISDPHLECLQTVTKETAHPHPIVFLGAINVDLLSC